MLRVARRTDSTGTWNMIDFLLVRHLIKSSSFMFHRVSFHVHQVRFVKSALSWQENVIRSNRWVLPIAKVNEKHSSVRWFDLVWRQSYGYDLRTLIGIRINSAKDYGILLHSTDNTLKSILLYQSTVWSGYTFECMPWMTSPLSSGSSSNSWGSNHLILHFLPFFSSLSLSLSFICSFDYWKEKTNCLILYTDVLESFSLLNEKVRARP